MKPQTFWLMTVMAGITLFLVACGEKSGPAVEEAPSVQPSEQATAPVSPANSVAPVGQSEVKLNNSFEQATLIKAGSTKGTLQRRDKSYFRFEVPGGASVQLVFTALDERCVDVELFDQRQKRIAKEGCTDEAKFTLLTSGSFVGGTYYLTAGTGTGSYILELTTKAQDDAKSGRDAGDDFQTALPLEKGEYTGQAGDLDKADYYRFQATSATVVEFYADVDARCCFEVVLFDGKQEAASSKQSVLSGQRLVFDFSKNGRDLPSGTYFLRVQSDGKGGNNYTIRIK